MSQNFTGFDEAGVQFLAGLRANNDKAWFDANRPVYEDHLMGPAKAFVVAAGEALRDLSPTVRAEPKVNGSILRINRDTRFSKDKAPYKEHLDFWFWDGTERASAVTGFYLRITPEAVGVGVGAHRFGPEQLTAYRGLVVAKAPATELVSAVHAVSKAGFHVRGEHYKRTPKGHQEPADPLVGRLLRHNALWSTQDFQHPGTFGSSRFVSWCLTRWRRQLPLHEWLRDHVP